jgi:GDPmannose 4,6-dehydratase
LGIVLEFNGKGQDEKGYIKKCNDDRFNIEIGKEVITVDKNYFRPTEVDQLIGDASKAKTKLGWEPKYSLEDLVKEMMESDIHLMQKEQYLKEGGFRTNNYFE